MMVFTCVSCQKKLTVKEDLAGRGGASAASGTKRSEAAASPTAFSRFSVCHCVPRNAERIHNHVQASLDSLAGSFAQG